jgi:hypothetical protein
MREPICREATTQRSAAPVRGTDMPRAGHRVDQHGVVAASRHRAAARAAINRSIAADTSRAEDVLRRCHAPQSESTKDGSRARDTAVWYHESVRTALAEVSGVSGKKGLPEAALVGRQGRAAPQHSVGRKARRIAACRGALWRAANHRLVGRYARRHGRQGVRGDHGRRLPDLSSAAQRHSHEGGRDALAGCMSWR